MDSSQLYSNLFASLFTNDWFWPCSASHVLQWRLFPSINHFDYIGFDFSEAGFIVIALPKCSPMTTSSKSQSFRATGKKDSFIIGFLVPALNYFILSQELAKIWNREVKMVLRRGVAISAFQQLYSVETNWNFRSYPLWTQKMPFA